MRFSIALSTAACVFCFGVGVDSSIEHNYLGMLVGFGFAAMNAGRVAWLSAEKEPTK